MSDFAAAALAWLASALARLGDAAPVLAGGAGGAILVWWLDGRRVARRERRQVIGAAELIGLELAANVSSLEIWLASAGHAPPLELRWEAWTAHQIHLAVAIPREIVGHIGASYYLARMLMHNAARWRARGTVTGNDVNLAKRVQDAQQVSLTELQTYVRRKLGVRFMTEPVPPARGGPEDTAPKSD